MWLPRAPVSVTVRLGTPTYDGGFRMSVLGGKLGYAAPKGRALRLVIASLGLALAFTVFARSQPARAVVIEVTTRPVTGDTIGWGQIGSAGTIFGTPQNFTSTDGATGVVTLAQNSNGEIEEQCCAGLVGIWDGNFAPGDLLLYTDQSGPLTLTFDAPVQSVGAQIAANVYGPFTAQVQAFDNSTLLGTFTENGVETDSADNSAIFLGVMDTAPTITSMVYSLTGSTDFAINQVTLSAPPASVPEPTSFVMLATGLYGLLGRFLYIMQWRPGWNPVTAA